MTTSSKAAHTTNLNTACFSRAFHSRRYVDRVSPNVIVRFAGTDDPRSDGSVVDPHLQYEVVETLLVEELQSFLHFERELHQQREMRPSHRDRVFWLEIK